MTGIRTSFDHAANNRLGTPDLSAVKNDAVAPILRKLLAFDPSERITANEFVNAFAPEDTFITAARALKVNEIYSRMDGDGPRPDVASLRREIQELRVGLEASKRKIATLESRL